MSLRLSTRLAAVAAQVLPGRPMADIGCDHAQLAGWVVQTGVVPHAIGSDLREGPLGQARAQLAEAGISRVELRRGSGLETLAPGDVATIALAGMGGGLMLSLLDAQPDIARQADRIILQPNTAWTEVRTWLAQRRLVLHDETLHEDAGRMYLTVSFCLRETGATWSPADIAVGPRLRRTRPPVFERWLAAEQARLDALADSLREELGATHPRVTTLLAEREALVRAAAAS
ncbi:MAG: class I SAM-dependent methyltransferase [Myxococcota bacterium]